MYVENGEVYDGVEYKIIEEITKGWPKKYENVKNLIPGRYDWGIIHDSVIYGKSDLAGCSQWQMFLVNKSIDYAYQYQQTCLTFLVPKPQLLPKITFTFQSFQLKIWLLTIFLVTLVSILMSFLNWLHHKVANIETFDVGAVILKSFGIFAQVSVPEPPLLLNSLRILLLAWCFTCLLLSTYYAAGMTSNLTSPRYTNNIKTIDDMINQQIHYYLKNNYFEDYFRTLNTTKFDALANLGRIGDRFSKLGIKTCVIVKVLGRNYVCDLETMANNLRKYYKVIDECIGNYYTGFVLKLNSPFTKLFEKQLMRFSEIGLFDYWIKNVSFTNERDQERFFTTYIDEPEYILIDLELIQGVFIFLCIGYLASVLVFVIECCNYKKNRKFRKSL